MWSVEQGEYSDYRVLGVYSTRENAETMRDFINAKESYRSAWVEELEVDAGLDAVAKGYKPFRIVMLRDGTTERADADAFHGGMPVTDLTVWRRSRARAYEGQNVADALHGVVWARTVKQAVKIANDRRAQLIASGEWAP